MTTRENSCIGGSAPMLERVSGFTAYGEIDSIAAVLNGTCIFVLDRCGQGDALEEAIIEAQLRGFAEA